MNAFHNYSEDQLFYLISKEGDKAAFAALYESCREMLFAKAYILCHQDEEAAKDAVQEVFLYLWKSRTKIQPTQGIRRYLLGAVQKRCADQGRQLLRRRERHNEYIRSANYNPSLSPLEVRELGNELNAAMALVSPNSLTAFVKHYIERKHMQEIAAEMKINVQSVKNHVQRALKVLRENLKKS
ncbi:MAG TPA: sigma-70 family RNA polymerase sigma factor [Chitinophaga sp.]|nr:sigma-70 family RNA polymerase sigma factor [Chitinophaga sp.]